MEKCNIKALAIAIGAVSAAYVFFLGITASFGWGEAIVDGISSLYIGYGPSFLGALIGAVWAFADGAIAGALIAWIYNMVAGK